MDTRPRWALATVCAVLFLTFLDTTVVSVALASIQESLHTGVSALQWVVDAYMLAFAALMLTGGAIGDILGRRRVMLAGVGLFAAGSLLAALAPAGGVLIAGRAVMGIGAAASEPGTLSIIRHLYPERAARDRALGAWAAVSGASLALGPILGGLLIAAGDWRNVFWFNLAFGVLVFAAALKLPESADPDGRRLDLPGLVLGGGSLTAVTFAVIEGETAGFGAWWIDLLFAVAAVFAVAFLWVEAHRDDPVLELRFFRNRRFAAANLVALASNFGVFAVFFLIALYLQLIASYSGTRIALQFVAMAAAIVVAAEAGSRWEGRRGPRGPIVIGCLIAAGGLFGVDAVLSPTVSVAVLSAPLAVAGIGFGLTLVAATSTVLALVPAERSGMAASTVNTSRQLGGVFGVAILGAVVNAQLTGSLAHKLVQLGIPANFRAIVIDAITHGAVVPATPAGAGAQAHGHAALVAQVIRAAEDSFGHGLHVSLLVAGGVLLAAAAAAFVAYAQPGGFVPLREIKAQKL